MQVVVRLFLLAVIGVGALFQPERLAARSKPQGPVLGKSDFHAKVVRNSENKRKIQGLSFSGAPLRIFTDEKGHPWAVVRGRYSASSAGMALLFGASAAKYEQVSGRFEAAIPLVGVDNPLKVAAVGARGKVQSEPIAIPFPDHAEFVETSGIWPDRKWKLWSEFYPSLFSYQEPAVSRPGIATSPAVSELGFIQDHLLFFAWRFFEKKSFRLHTELDATVTTIPYSSSRGLFLKWGGSANVLVDFPRMFYIRARPVALRVGLGFYYLTTFHNASNRTLAFGFGNLVGPRLLAEAKIGLKKDQHIRIGVDYGLGLDGTMFLGASTWNMGGFAKWQFKGWLNQNWVIALRARHVSIVFGGSDVSMIQTGVGVGLSL